MMTNKEFVSGIWEKCNKANNEKFYKKHQYKFIETVRIIKTTIISILGVMVLSGAVYAGYSGVNYVIEKYTQTNNLLPKGQENPMNISHEIGDIDWIMARECKYIVVENYNDYLEVKELFDNFLEMEEKDFDEYFVIVGHTLGVANNGSEVVNAYLKDDVLNIELAKEDESEISPYFIFSTKIKKELYSENIDFKFISNIAKKKELRDLTELYDGYSVEEALQDGCFIVDDYEIISHDKYQFDKFVKNMEEGKEDYIRTYWINPYNKNQVHVTDLKCNNHEVLMNAISLDQKDKLWTRKMFFVELKTIEYENGITFYCLGGSPNPNEKYFSQLYTIEYK